MKSSGHSLLLSRGFIKESDIIIDHYDISENNLRERLFSKIPVERTKTAIIIKKLKIKESVPDLLEALRDEKKLYSKIAIQEALISLKDQSVEKLIPYLGSIGKNQYHKLPSKPFEKNNYPLPRDIVARILVNCGIDVIHKLLNEFKKLKRYEMLEAIDVLGYISFYHKNNESLPLLLDLYDKNKKDSIMIWKILRAFSAFNDERVILILEDIINKKEIIQYTWEAKRSLRLLKHRNK